MFVLNGSVVDWLRHCKKMFVILMENLHIYGEKQNICRDIKFYFIEKKVTVKFMVEKLMKFTVK